MTLVFITILTLAIFKACHTVACPQEYIRMTKDHSVCKPANSSCRFVTKGLQSEQEKTEIVNIHNQYRNYVALGGEKKAGGLPTASNMLALSWDDELANTAQKWVEQCMFAHDCYECRGSRSFPVGQNIAYNWYPCSGQCAAFPPMWGQMIKMFYDEVGDFDKSLVRSFNYNWPKMIGHFSQLVWAETYRVGCGYASYEENSGLTQLYVCNYGKAGNMNEDSVYDEGMPCSKCPQNSCCGSSCTNQEQNKYQGLCFLSSYPPVYPPKQGLLYYCTFERNNKACEIVSEGPAEWTFVETAGGTLLSAVVPSGNTAVVHFRQPINAIRGSCMYIRLKKGPNEAGLPDVSSLDIEFENNGQKNQESVWTYPWSDFITTMVPINYDGELKFSLKMTVPPNASPQFLELKKIEITREECKYAK